MYMSSSRRKLFYSFVLRPFAVLNERDLEIFEHTKRTAKRFGTMRLCCENRSQIARGTREGLSTSSGPLAATMLGSGNSDLPHLFGTTVSNTVTDRYSQHDMTDRSHCGFVISCRRKILLHKNKISNTRAAMEASNGNWYSFAILLTLI